jgi:hypothetical protein
MNKITIGAIGVSAVLLLGTLPTAVRGHDGEEHEGQRSEYEVREDARRYEPQYEDDWQEDAEDSDEA